MYITLQFRIFDHESDRAGLRLVRLVILGVIPGFAALNLVVILQENKVLVLLVAIRSAFGRKRCMNKSVHRV
jgi:hypothetical protein